MSLRSSGYLLVLPAEVEAGARQRVVAALRRRVTLGEICGVGCDLAGDDAGLERTAGASFCGRLVLLRSLVSSIRSSMLTPSFARGMPTRRRGQSAPTRYLISHAVLCGISIAV